MNILPCSFICTLCAYPVPTEVPLKLELLLLEISKIYKLLCKQRDVEMSVFIHADGNINWNFSGVHIGNREYYFFSFGI